MSTTKQGNVFSLSALRAFHGGPALVANVRSHHHIERSQFERDGSFGGGAGGVSNPSMQIALNRTTVVQTSAPNEPSFFPKKMLREWLGRLIKLIRRFIQKLGQLVESRINLSLLPVVIRRFSLNCGIYRADVRS